MYKTNF